MTALDHPRRVNVAVALRNGLFLLILALAFGFVGPFGTSISMPALPRFAYWLATVAAIGGGMSLAARLLARYVFPRGLPWWALAVAGLAMALPGTVVVEHCLALFAPDLVGKVDRTTILLQVLALNLAIPPVFHLILRGFDKAGPEAPPIAAEATLPPPPPAADPYPFAERLPEALRRSPILAVSAEDHYLRVHTEAGNALILMRLADATALLAGQDGLQVHRSHWVARAAVQRAERRDGQTVLHLGNDLAIPVSRSRLRALHAAGWPSR